MRQPHDRLPLVYNPNPICVLDPQFAVGESQITLELLTHDGALTGHGFASKSHGSVAEAQLGEEVAGQLLAHPKSLGVAACVLLMIGAIPDLPRFPFCVVALVLGGAALGQSEPESPDEDAEVEMPAEEEPMQAVMDIDPLGIEVGYGLIGLVDEQVLLVQ